MNRLDEPVSPDGELLDGRSTPFDGHAYSHYANAPAQRTATRIEVEVDRWSPAPVTGTGIHRM